MVNLTAFLLIISVVTCVALWCDRSCEDALSDFCSDDGDDNTVCNKCLEDDDGLCHRTNDPLFCYMHLKEGSNCTWASALCNTTTNLSYGCYRSQCYSQCVGEDYGDGEWCYLAKRQPGPLERFSCESNEDCLPDLLGTVQCYGSCDTTFKK